MYRRLRILSAGLLFAGICLAFLDVSGILGPRLAFLAKLQIVPAILAGSLAVTAGLILLTLISGRLYCAAICPLGVMQDIISRLGRKNRFHYTPPSTRLRLAALGLFILAFLLGWPLVFGLLEPYSAFGRIATDMAWPVWASGSNVLAWASERAGNFIVGPTPIWQKGISSLAAALLTLSVVGILAWKSGRSWCNTFCPVGTVLGFLSRYSLIRPRFRQENCNRCGLCERACKASCINSKAGTLDASRCVSCFNCHHVCRQDAIGLLPLSGRTSPGTPQAETRRASRRFFLGTVLGLAALPFAAQGAVPEKTARALTRKSRPEREVPIVPPGAVSRSSFQAKCTGCQLCVAACPNQVLRTQDTGAGMLQPALSFERGYCRVNCVTCPDVCPTGAIRTITAAEKSAIQIGRAAISLEHCIVNTDDVPCTACSRNCPTGAISLVEGAKHELPAVDAERCTGCGACEYNCPVRPRSAIWVEGNLVHRQI
jgi:ferredoxin-type protein NapF